MAPPDVSLAREPRAKYVRSLPAVPKKTTRVELSAGLRAVGVFAGIGGFELGLSSAGHQALQVCEIEAGARAVLRARFPGVECAPDITKLDGLPARTELLVGGFPCQDLSQAGRTAGLAGKNSGLVAHVFRLIQGQRPRWVILENVSFMLSLARGQALASVLGELKRLGYHWAYRVVDTRSFGLPQRRERVFIVAALDADPRSVLFADDAGIPPASIESANPSAFGFYWTEGTRGVGWGSDVLPTLKGGSTIGIASPPAIWVPGGKPEIVRPDIRDAERMQGFDPDWTLPAEDVTRAGHRWKLVGNAVTVNVARWLGGRLRKPGNYHGERDAKVVHAAKWPRAAYDVGSGTHSADISSWPIATARPPLLRFLCYPTAALSLRATAGFLKRAELSSLKFDPGFLPALRSHVGAMSRDRVAED